MLLGIGIPVLLVLVGGSGVIAAMVAFFMRIYHRVPPSEVMVIYGNRETRFVSGRGSFVSPMVEDFQFLDLTVKTVKKEADEVYTTDGIPILLDWVAQVQIDSREEILATAARAFLGKDESQIQLVITETLSANFRAIVGRMTVEEIHRDRDAFVLTVQQLASNDMEAMGVRIISMGIEEITDGLGYFEAMAAPQIAAIKRDARIAEAEAERAARVKSAHAMREAEQAELEAERDILEQKQALQLREVERSKTVGLEEAKAQQSVQMQRAKAVEQEQEAEVLVPARAKREATEIEADAERMQRTGNAEAERLRALKAAEAESTRNSLMAEAEGRRELARASAAEGEINLRQFVIETLARADVEKTAHIADALAGVGNNVKIVQFAGGNGADSPTGVTLLDMLLNVPEFATMLNAKVEALSGEGIEPQVERVLNMLAGLRVVGDSEVDSHSSNGMQKVTTTESDE